MVAFEENEDTNYNVGIKVYACYSACPIPGHVYGARYDRAVQQDWTVTNIFPEARELWCVCPVQCVVTLEFSVL